MKAYQVKERPEAAPNGSTTERLVDQLRARHHVGLRKYGVTVDRDDLTPIEWVQHLREELLDGLAYLQRVEDRISDLNAANARLQERLTEAQRAAEK